jgi:sulfoxide reductase heme-binding subunit YedZ
MLRRLGGKRWQAIHRLVYLAAILGIVHFLWSQKKDVTLPVRYAVVLGVILGARLVPRRRAVPRAPVARPG